MQVVLGESTWGCCSKLITYESGILMSRYLTKYINRMLDLQRHQEEETTLQEGALRWTHDTQGTSISSQYIAFMSRYHAIYYIYELIYSIGTFGFEIGWNIERRSNIGVPRLCIQDSNVRCNVLYCCNSFRGKLRWCNDATNTHTQHKLRYLTTHNRNAKQRLESTRMEFD